MRNKNKQIVNLRSKYLKKRTNPSSTFNGVLSLINLHFWKAFVGPFFAFGYPIVFVLMLGIIFGYEIVMGASITIGPVAIACVSLPTAIFEFKKSTLLKRIGATQIKPLTFLAYTAIYYFFIMILSGIWTALFALMIFGPKYFNEGRILYEFNFLGEQIKTRSISIKQMFKNIDWLGYIYSFIILTLVSISVGLFIVSISKSVLMIQAIGSSLLIISMFLTGQVLPLAQIANVEAMWYLSYITPFKSAITQNTMAFQGTGEISKIYDLNNFMINFGALDLNGNAENALYSIQNYQDFLQTVIKNYNLINPESNYYIGKTFGPIATLQIKPALKDLIILKMISLSPNIDVAINYKPYSIFNTNEIYHSVNSLSTYSPIIKKYEDVLTLTANNAINEIIELKKAAQGGAATIQNNIDLISALTNSNQYNEILKSGQIDNDTINNIFTDIKNNPILNEYNNSFISINNGSINENSLTQVGSTTENILNLIIPWIWICSLICLSQSSFKWSTR
ncbi:ABC transporter permease [Metamycoplasma neophronis]|uniref:ABC transporter permease n=1 Tax=Metamycoplasma neophronis TaxID=872983 RepID=A0ABY2Z4V2_9BACT|nr:ABC transporter permease [Metamycoplasma neophronis]TPR53703.1 ABC transporter permease [Metamycoplasma neophronis]